MCTICQHDWFIVVNSATRFFWYDVDELISSIELAKNTFVITIIYTTWDLKRNFDQLYPNETTCFSSLFKMAPKVQKNDRNVAVGLILARKRLEDIERRFNVWKGNTPYDVIKEHTLILINTHIGYTWKNHTKRKNTDLKCLY